MVFDAPVFESYNLARVLNQFVLFLLQNNSGGEGHFSALVARLDT